MKLTVSVDKSKPWWWRKRFRLTFVSTALACLVYLTLFGLGLVPKTLQYQPTQTTTTDAGNEKQSVERLASLSSTPVRLRKENPTRIVAEAAGVNTVIRNPASKRPAVLNDYLTQGAVRYPASGYPGNGNLFLFGHSTSYNTVQNQAYKTFNNIEKLSSGDKVTVHTQSGIYEYTVSEVEFKENSAAYVPLDTNKDMLTISTCDSFGSKEDRIVVRSTFTGYTPSSN